MNSYEYIVQVKQAKGLDTDYKVAKLLGWKQNKITQYRNGQGMDNEAARQIAQVLNVPVWQIIADMEIQRAKDEPTRKAWKMLQRVRKESGEIAPNLLITKGIVGSVVALVCILCKIDDTGKRRLSNVSIYAC